MGHFPSIKYTWITIITGFPKARLIHQNIGKLENINQARTLKQVSLRANEENCFEKSLVN